jgi:cytochrome P450
VAEIESLSAEYQLNSAELVADPYTAFGRIREEGAVARGRLADGSPVWIVTRHGDVTAALEDPRFVSNPLSLPGAAADTHAESLRKYGISKHLVPYLAGNLIHTDPPDHTRLRKLVTRAFSARQVTALLPRIRAITGELLDALPGGADAGADAGAVDLIEHFAYPLPITIICEMLGVPAQDRPKWRAWSQDYTSMSMIRMNAMLAKMSEYLRDLIERRRAEPGSDVLTHLVQARDDSDRLSDTELITMVLTLMIAGHETTAHLIGNGVLALLTHPDQLALLRADPALAPAAVQELLRWCSPVVTAKLRYAAQAMTLDGTPIGPGDAVLTVLGSANHDPRRFTEPEALDITRSLVAKGAAHLAYSHGPHYCLGATLANQETEVALTALFARYPDLALAAPPGGLEWRTIPGTRQLVRLPVRLGRDGKPGRDD